MEMWEVLDEAQGGGGWLRRRRKAQDEEISWAVVFQVRCLAIPTTRPRFRGNVVEAGRVSDSAGEGWAPAHQESELDQAAFESP